jgi:hypothetical protein
MNKQIRPLAAFKKAYPEYYAKIEGLSKDDNSSKKGGENMWYWWYGSLQMDLGGDNTSGKRREDPFFFNTEGNKTNIGTVSEIGRLLLTGWSYSCVDWTKEVSSYVYRAYQKKRERGDTFNDLEFKEAVKHIRENIGYYYHNNSELKLYILETFFKEDIEHILPEPPKILREHENAKELLEYIDKGKSKEWYRKMYYILDSYWYYLSEILDTYNIPHLSLQEFKERDDKEAEGYAQEIKKAKDSYRSKLKELPLNKYLKGRG